MWQMFRNRIAAVVVRFVVSDSGTIKRRTMQQQEIDLVEEMDGRLAAFEFKWGKAKAKLPKPFADNYPECGFKVISPDDYVDFIS